MTTNEITKSQYEMLYNLVSLMNENNINNHEKLEEEMETSVNTDESVYLSIK